MARRRGTTNELAGFLKTVPLFSACTKRELAIIAAIGREVHFPEGAQICREGEVGIGMHVVLEGETKVQIGGRTKRRLGPGAFFGEISLLDGGPRTATVVTETPVRTLSIPVWQFRSVLKKHPAITTKLLEEVCRRVRSSETSLTT